jgi:glycosyltransferase involved in cell wall biosynthesis
MSEVLFSVIIPTLNEEKFLPHLLDSLVTQTDRDFEVIVSDGNSEDKTVEIAKSYENTLPNLTVLTVDPPGLAKQRNHAAKVAKGKWLLFTDADGIFLPYALNRMRTFIEQTNPYHFSPWFAADSGEGGDALLTLMITAAMEASLMMKRPVAFGQFSAIERSIFEKVNGYNEIIKWGEDNDISRRIFEAGHKLKIVRETLIIYSLRRFRREGTLKILQTYSRAAFQVLLTKKPPTDIPGYIMGGHLYSSTKEAAKGSTMLKTFQERLKKLTRELFS